MLFLLLTLELVVMLVFIVDLAGAASRPLGSELVTVDLAGAASRPLGSELVTVDLAGAASRPLGSE